MLKWMGRAALELLGQGALGYSFDPLVGDTTNDFAEAVKSFLYVFAFHHLFTQACLGHHMHIEIDFVCCLPARRSARCPSCE